MPAALPIISGVASVAQGVGSVVGANDEAKAIQEQGRYQAEGLRTNARLSDMQAEDARRRGEADVSTRRTQVRQVAGSQRAALAAQGVDIASGSAADVVADTETQGELDTLTLRNNAWREAWGFKVQANDQRKKAMLAERGAAQAAGTTLLTGGLKALGYGAQAASSFANAGGKK